MKYLTFFFLLFLSASGYAQITLRGKVVDENQTPIMGVNVFLQGTIEGTSSDEEGRFQFVTQQKGNVVLMCKYLGMNDATLSLTLQTTPPDLLITMTEKESALDEVVLTGGAFSVDDRKRAVVLNTMDVSTTPGGNDDIISTLITLPGTQQVGESGLLFVRGGSSEESKVTIDGLDILNPFYAGVPEVAQRNRFSPHIFKGIIFNTGGYSAQYGNALSSVLSLETNDHPSKPSTVIALLPYGAQVGHDFLSKTETRSGGFDVGYFNFKPYHQIVKQNVEWLKAPESMLLSGTFRQNTSGNGFLKWYGYGNIMRQAINQLSVEVPGSKEPYESKNANAVSILTYTRDIASDWKLYTGYGLNYNRDKITNGLLYSDNYALQHQFRAMASGALTNNINAEVGMEGFAYQSSYGNDYNTAIWGSAAIGLTKKLMLQTGLRTEYDQQLNKAVVLPRASIAYKSGKYHQLNLSVGEYSQRPIESYLAYYQHLTFSKATHYIANFQYNRDRRVFRIEGYHKPYSHLLAYRTPTLPNNTGKGYASGIDVFWRDAKTVKGLEYWLSYSYLDAERQFLHYPVAARPTFATPHTGNVVLKYFFEELGLFVGGSYSVSSGRPYENPNNPVFLSDITPVQQNVNANIALLRKGKGVFHTMVFSVNNLTGETPIFNYRYSRDGSYRLPVTLPYKRSYMLGWFISIGKDRSDEILNQLP